MPIKYLCVDDEKDTPERYLNLISKTIGDGIEFERSSPRELSEQLNQIKEIASARPNQFGLILDLRLDRDPDDNGYSVPYRGSSLAQELRTRMAEGPKEMVSFPIVLWSIDERFKRSYEADDTSHDLFDCVYIKDVDITERPRGIGLEMQALVSGYQVIRESREAGKLDLSKLLGIPKEQVEILDPRIIEALCSRLEIKSDHEIAQFILNELIRAEGLLIDEDVLAARMGVDITESKDSWNALKEHLNVAEYTGVFSSAWPRWWAYEVDAWWSQLKEKQIPLRRLSANERVSGLNELFNLKLVMVSPIEEGYSGRYWTVCQILRRPLDSVDGLRAVCPNLKPWQDPPYLSVKAVLERLGGNKWRVHPLEYDRLERLKRAG